MPSSNTGAEHPIARMLGDAMALPARAAAWLDGPGHPADSHTAGSHAIDSDAPARRERTHRAVGRVADASEHTPAHARDRGGVDVAIHAPDDGTAPSGAGGPAADVHSPAGTAPIAAPGFLTRPHREVDYTIFSGITAELDNPGGTLPGSNLWDAPPNRVRPVPVVLVHGTGGGRQTNWGTYVPLLANHGFSVFALTYGAVPGSSWPLSAVGGLTPIEDSAAEFGAFVEKVLAATGARQIDVVGHSQGTIVPDYWAKFLGGAGKIRRYVSLAPLWQGTGGFSGISGTLGSLTLLFGSSSHDDAAALSLPEMLGGSELTRELNSGGGPYLPGIEYTNISTRYDEFVIPYTSGQLPGGPAADVTNIVVQDGCSEDWSDHLAIVASQRAATMVLDKLDDLGHTEVPCEFVAPIFG